MYKKAILILLRFCLLLPFLLLNFFELKAQNSYTRMDIQLPILETTEVDIDALTKTLYVHFSILEETNSQLKLIHKLQSPGGWHYTFAQQYEGVTIHKGLLKANLNRFGKVTSCMNNLKVFDKPSNIEFGYDELVLVEQISSEFPEARFTIEKRLQVDADALKPIYRLLIHEVKSGLNEERIYNGNLGELYTLQDVNSYFTLADTSGKGRVFNPNPCTKGEVRYGLSFIDADDAHSVVLESLMDTIELNDLRYEGGQFLLEGPYVKVEDIVSPNKPPVVSDDGDFFYGRDQSGFEDVMSYYHIDKFQRYVQSLGFTNLQNRPLRVDTHADLNDNSSFVPNFGDSYIKFGEGGVDDGEDADVIIHEYAHALSYAATAMVMTEFERKAIDEGFGDYFAASYSRDISEFEWYNVFNWDGHNEFWPGRDAATTNTYPPSEEDIYIYGEVWASTLMRIREEIGAEVGDRLVLQEMYSNIDGMSFADAAMLLLDADSILYNGEHTEIINFYCCQSNIRPQAVCLSVDLDNEMKASKFLVFPNPNKGQFHLSYPDGKNHQFLIYNHLGQEIYQTDLPLTGKASLQTHLPRGLYIGIIKGDGSVLYTEKILIE